ncbi:MAG: single-stranded-DNA-specific exonuclease RecJ [Chitinophagaceae bacterium]|nr:single-stranded-DNA-specific exonuclease RecJ [Chitinophagaceae bacterium]
MKRWRLMEADDFKVQQLQKALGINSILCKILVQQKITNFEEAKRFFRPSLEELHDPFLMKDMEIAVQRIQKAITTKEKILIYGDYDVDGTTSVGCMYRFIASIYNSSFVDFYIPNRYREGYGISSAGIDFAINNNFTLVIALDCGIKSIELIHKAKQHQIEFIICDHHIPGEILPEAVAILNPKQVDCNYPYKELCGCGIGFKLITALSHRLGLPASAYLEFLDLTATAIAADIVPMTGENRTIAWFGLKKANENPCKALTTLLNISKIKEHILIHHLVFMIAPRVNAAGRMDDARKVVQLFIENDEAAAKLLAEELQSDNADRKITDQAITEEALSLLLQLESKGRKKSTVVYQPHWHKGVVGIVASRLIEQYHRPTIVLTKSGDTVTGSGRSILGFNLHDGLEQCKDLLLGFGGHYFAAGMTLLPENVELLAERFEEIVSNTVEEKYFTPVIDINAEISLSDCTTSFYNIIKQMEPFGPENQHPVFCVRAVKNVGSKIVKDVHLRFVVQQNQSTFTGIGFNLANKFSIVDSGNPFDMVFALEENHWNNNTSLQLKVIDIKPSI